MDAYTKEDTIKKEQQSQRKKQVPGVMVSFAKWVS